MYQKQKINGLIYLPQFISKEHETEIILSLLDKEWNTSLKRRTQHYGYSYSYDKIKLEVAKPLPGLFQITKKEIQAYLRGHIEEWFVFDQAIVNEYLPGQGISSHVDHKILFGTIIASLSLNSDAIMVFEGEKGQKIQKNLQRRSLLILTNESRYDLKHSIPSRKSDHGIQRQTRYSLTFRKVIKKQTKL